ncbi:MAG: hypothetical protein JO039_09805, partial [Solirubrobacterales bacterium]|nr:hypothetical protein [Solirubrobacterales bacterium]
ADGSVVCWGLGVSGESNPPPERFISVSAGFTHTCGVRTDHIVACWGDDRNGQL